MAKYHINPETGNANVCTAKVKCKFTSDDGVVPPHYDSQADARRAVEIQFNSTHSAVLSHRGTAKTSPAAEDTRTVEDLTKSIADGDQKVSSLQSDYDSSLKRCDDALDNYKAVHKTGAAANSKKIEDAFWSTQRAIEDASLIRANLLRTRYDVAESKFALDKKENPDRFQKRSEALAALQPKTRNGKETLKKMKKNLQDSEKELLEVQKSADAIAKMRETSTPEDADNPSTISTVQSHEMRRHSRMMRNARATVHVTKQAGYYEVVEGLEYNHPSVEALKASAAETEFAHTMSQQQLSTWLRVRSEKDSNALVGNYIKTLERERESLSAGSVDRLNEINEDLKVNRAEVESREVRHERATPIINETRYKGFSETL